MFLRSARMALTITLLGITLLAIFGPAACAPHAPPPVGSAIVRSDQLDDPKSDGVIDAPISGKYGCYKEGVAEPLETFTLNKGDPVGFEIRQSDQGRGRTVPVLHGIAGKESFVLPMGDKYVWKRM